MNKLIICNNAHYNYSCIHFYYKERDLRHPIGPSMALGKDGKPMLHGTLPKSTGDNKLTEEMVPGYTGKSLKFEFSK